MSDCPCAKGHSVGQRISVASDCVSTISSLSRALKYAPTRIRTLANERANAVKTVAGKIVHRELSRLQHCSDVASREDVRCRIKSRLIISPRWMPVREERRKTFFNIRLEVYQELRDGNDGVRKESNNARNENRRT